VSETLYLETVASLRHQSAQVDIYFDEAAPGRHGGGTISRC